MTLLLESILVHGALVILVVAALVCLLCLLALVLAPSLDVEGIDERHVHRPDIQ